MYEILSILNKDFVLIWLFISPKRDEYKRGFTQSSNDT